MASPRCCLLIAVLSVLRLSHVQGLHIDGIFDDVDDTPPVSCVPLKNRGSFFTAKVNVGRPEQPLNIIADTTRGNLIVTSCNCQGNGCSKDAACFNVQDSRTLLSDKKKGTPTKGHDFMEINDRFKLRTYLATDSVRVGGRKAVMNDGVFVAHRIDDTRTRNGEDIGAYNGPFEGFFGLGMPYSAMDVQDHDFKVVGMPTFMQTAGVSRFSACTRNNADGVLELFSNPVSNAMSTLGKNLWAVELADISVGPVSSSTRHDTPLYSCEKEGDTEAVGCGAVLDLATTGIMGPTHKVFELVTAMCDNWNRCLTAADQFPTKVDAFYDTLFHCDEWGHAGLDEMPAIKFNVQDSFGYTQLLTIKPKDYVMVFNDEDLEDMADKFDAFNIKKFLSEPRSVEDVCVLAVGNHDAKAEKAEHTWFLGQPLFSSYKVVFDEEDPEDTFVSFVDTQHAPCDVSNCGASPITTLLSSIKAHDKSLWRLTTAPRVPSLGKKLEF